MDNINDIEIFENDIELYINEFMEKYNISDMTLESQNRWNACLMYINKHLFSGNRVLKDTTSQYNEYDYNKLLYILDIYLYYSNLFSKECSINGYCNMTGVEYSNIMQWAHDNLNPKRLEIYQKLIKANEQSNSDLLGSGKNPVGIIARLNHHHGWNSPYVAPRQNEKTVKIEQLPDVKPLELSDNSTQ